VPLESSIKEGPVQGAVVHAAIVRSELAVVPPCEYVCEFVENRIVTDDVPVFTGMITLPAVHPDGTVAIMPEPDMGVVWKFAAQEKENELVCTVPTAPAVPVAPVGPVAPVEPVGPIGPVPPVAPVEPVGPVGPVPPVGPVGPATPVGPVAPAGPVGPTWPVPHVIVTALVIVAVETVI
jgi:hypothetical protein